jgi:prolyl-tRNA synthetase
VIQAYNKVYERCGLPSLVVEADSGAIGGKESHEFMVITESGEDQVLYCSKCNYSANVERAESVKPPGEKEEPLTVEEVSTPGMKTIEEVSGFLGIPKQKTIKAIFYVADGEMVFVAIRGDLEANEIKLKNALQCHELRLATDEEAAEAGLVAGSASLAGVTGVKSIADPSITLGANFVAGANKPDTHLKNVNYPRDFTVDLMTDIATAQAGEGCPRCGSKLLSTRGIEVGHVFKLGTFFSEKLGAKYVDQNGVERPIYMGCYGIGIGRLLAAAIEQNHDEKGIIWPIPIAPYHVHLCPLSTDNEQVVSAAEKLYLQLKEMGLEVLYDDRIESPGVKLNDADLLGMPLRLILSNRTVSSGSVEVKERREKDAALLPWEEVEDRLKAILSL